MLLVYIYVEHMIQTNQRSCAVLWLIRCLQYLRPVIELSGALIDNGLSRIKMFTWTNMIAYLVGIHLLSLFLSYILNYQILLLF